MLMAHVEDSFTLEQYVKEDMRKLIGRSEKVEAGEGKFMANLGGRSSRPGTRTGEKQGLGDEGLKMTRSKEKTSASSQRYKGRFLQKTQLDSLVKNGKKGWGRRKARAL